MAPKGTSAIQGSAKESLRVLNGWLAAHGSLISHSFSHSFSPSSTGQVQLQVPYVEWVVFRVASARGIPLKSIRKQHRVRNSVSLPWNPAVCNFRFLLSSGSPLALLRVDFFRQDCLTITKVLIYKTCLKVWKPSWRVDFTLSPLRSFANKRVGIPRLVTKV